MRLIDGDVGSLWEGHSGGGARRAVDQRGLGPVVTILYPYEVTNGAGPAREAYRGHADAMEILITSDVISGGKGLKGGVTACRDFVLRAPRTPRIRFRGV